MATLMDRIKAGWNVFMNKDPTPLTVRENYSYGYGYSRRPDRTRLSKGNERSIINSIYNRIAIDVAAIPLEHADVDEDGRFQSTRNSGLNEVLNVEANLDQTGREFRQDIVMSMLDEGVVALVPVDTTTNPKSGAYDIQSMRTGQILEWYPREVRVKVYNDRTGRREELKLPKRYVGIIENPLYSVMNEPNSTLQRLIRKLNILDIVDEQSGSGKLDIIIQLPYTIRTEQRKREADKRKKNIEEQLAGSKYGVAYIDAAEKITQLNRPAENNLLKQIELLQTELYSQLGITKGVFEGTADEKEKIDYYNRTIEPILSAIADEAKRKFLTPTARTQGQSIVFFRDPFKLATVQEIAELADKLGRNEIATPNEMRSTIGWRPSKDPKADELRNRNVSESKEDQNGGESMNFDTGGKNA